MRSMKTGLAALALASAAGGVLAGETVVAEFAIHDHPEGGFAPPTYALRLDYIFGDFRSSFSADVYNDATLTVLQDGAGSFFIDIAGTFRGGEDTGDAFSNEFDISASFRYAANITDVGNGWQVDGFTTLNSGTITRLDTNETTTWYGMTDDTGENGPIGSSFLLASDGFRITGDDSTWVGRGWLTTNDDGSMAAAPAQDWLFAASVIPSPSSMALLGMGGLIAARRRR
jgi:hypothetical protein